VAKQKAGANKTRDLIIRVVVFGTLAVVLVLAYMDYRVKQQATQTGKAWRDLLTEANANHAADLPVDKLKESMQGSPEVSEKDHQNVYTWKGSFRSYAIRVNYDRSLVKAVTDIEGP
jgi:hypothetical protein